MSWEQFLQDGISSAIDGYVSVEQEKAKAKGDRIEQTPPATTSAQTPNSAVSGAMSANNMQVAGITVDKRVLMGAGVIIGLIALKKVL